MKASVHLREMQLAVSVRPGSPKRRRKLRLAIVVRRFGESKESGVVDSAIDAPPETRIDPELTTEARSGIESDDENNVARIFIGTNVTFRCAISIPVDRT